MPVVYLQRVPEPKTVKNRLHLDLRTAQPEETIKRLLALGATKLGTPDDRQRRRLVASHVGPRRQRVLCLQLRLAALRWLATSSDRARCAMLEQYREAGGFAVVWP